MKLRGSQSTAHTEQTQTPGEEPHYENMSNPPSNMDLGDTDAGWSNSPVHEAGGLRDEAEHQLHEH